MNKITILDCTLRDGGYHNNWDFSIDLIDQYLIAIKAAGVDVVELGFRFLKNQGFKGACAFTTDDFIKTLKVPEGLTVSVMINGADLCTEIGWQKALEKLFPVSASETAVDIVRIACHFEELPMVVKSIEWLNLKGYRVGLNLMQIADRTKDEIDFFAKVANDVSIEVLYFADSTGSMTPESTAEVIGWLKESWKGSIGIHSHDNMGRALINTIRAADEGVEWLDATVAGMGRGPGNVRTEELVVEIKSSRSMPFNLVPLMSLINEYFEPMKSKYGWGVNPFYHLAGKFGIHPSYIQEMLGDTRYKQEDIFSVIEYLRLKGGKKFCYSELDQAKNFYYGESRGIWSPEELIAGREVLILGGGPGVKAHLTAIESYVRRTRPIVIGLNAQSQIDESLIDLRIACHPMRLLADIHRHLLLNQPLIAPLSMMPEELKNKLIAKKVLDFGIGISEDGFEFSKNFCKVPKPLVLAYALAMVTSGGADKILLAGFDGYESDNLKNKEIETIIKAFRDTDCNINILSITPTIVAGLTTVSIYAL